MVGEFSTPAETVQAKPESNLDLEHLPPELQVKLDVAYAQLTQHEPIKSFVAGVMPDAAELIKQTIELYLLDESDFNQPLTYDHPTVAAKIYEKIQTALGLIEAI